MPHIELALRFFPALRPWHYGAGFGFILLVVLLVVVLSRR